jgi:hypothetical protein
MTRTAGNTGSGPQHRVPRAKPWVDHAGMACILCDKHEIEMKNKSRSKFEFERHVRGMTKVLDALDKITFHLVGKRLVILPEIIQTGKYKRMRDLLHSNLSTSCGPTGSSCSGFRRWDSKYHFKIVGCKDPMQLPQHFQSEFEQKTKKSIKLKLMDSTDGESRIFEIFRSPKGARKNLNEVTFLSARGDGCVFFVTNRDLAIDLLDCEFQYDGLWPVKPWASSHEHQYCYDCHRRPGAGHETYNCPAPRCSRCGLKDHARGHSKCQYSKDRHCYICESW